LAPIWRRYPKSKVAKRLSAVRGAYSPLATPLLGIVFAFGTACPLGPSFPFLWARPQFFSCISARMWEFVCFMFCRCLEKFLFFGFVFLGRALTLWGHLFLVPLLIKVVMSSTMFIKVVSDLYNKHKSKWRSLIFQLTCFFPV